MTTYQNAAIRMVVPLAALAAILVLAGPASADNNADTPDVAATSDRYELSPGITLGGEFRGQLEERQNFQFGDGLPGDDESFGLTRIRVNTQWQVSENLTLFFEGQDSRIHDQNAISDSGIPNVYEDRFDLHQAWVDWKTSFGTTPVSLRIGRQQFDFGAGRLVSSDQWLNTARAWDAVRLTFGTPDERTIDLFYSALVPVRPGNFNDHDAVPHRYMDSEFWGLYWTDWKLFSNTRFEGYALHREEGRVDDEVWTLGFRSESKSGALDFELGAALQWGDFGDIDHDAWMAHFGFGYTAESFMNSRFGLGFNYATGDDNALDTDHETFDGLFPASHEYYGYMDGFSLQNMRNIELSWEAPINTGHLRVAFHRFWLDDADDFWYDSLFNPARPIPVTADDEVGDEIDITFRWPMMDGKVTMLAGFSHVWTGDYISDTGTSRDPNYFYLQSEVKF